MKKTILLAVVATVALSACSSKPTKKEIVGKINDNAEITQTSFSHTAAYEQERLNHSIEMFNKIAMNQCGDTGVHSFNQTGKFLYIRCERKEGALNNYNAKKFTVQIRD